MKPCASCPFLMKDERESLRQLTSRAPSEFWPCHEVAEFDDLTDTECQGHRDVANSISALAVEVQP